MTTVYAFDRDRTVDVNPHPDRAAVPLAWVEALRDRAGVDVWAIGNQRLRYEAAVPGVPELLAETGTGTVTARVLTGMLWLEWHLHRYPILEAFFTASAPHVDESMMPARAERLSLLAELYGPGADLIVVDDADLADVDGWTHYYPWEFVTAVDEGTLDLGLDFDPGRDPDSGRAPDVED